MEELAYDKSFRTPVERAFYESFLLCDRYNVARLYALNVAASTKFKNKVIHLGHERKAELHRIDNEIESVRKQLDQMELAKDQVRYLPTKKQEKFLPSLPVNVIHDVHKQSRCAPPVFLTHIKTFRKKSLVKKTEVIRKPLHLPKYTRPKLKEISRFVHDSLLFENSTGSNKSSGSTSFNSELKALSNTSETGLLSPRVSPIPASVSFSTSVEIIPEKNLLPKLSIRTVTDSNITNVGKKCTTIPEGAYQHKMDTTHSLQSSQKGITSMPSVEEVELCSPMKADISKVIGVTVDDSDGEHISTNEPENYSIRSITVQTRDVQFNDAADKSMEAERICSNSTCRRGSSISPITSIENLNIALNIERKEIFARQPKTSKVTFPSVIDVIQEDSSEKVENNTMMSIIEQGYEEMKKTTLGKPMCDERSQDPRSRFDKRISLAPVQEEAELGVEKDKFSNVIESVGGSNLGSLDPTVSQNYEWKIRRNTMQWCAEQTNDAPHRSTAAEKMHLTHSHEYDLVLKEQKLKKTKSRSKSVYIIDQNHDLHSGSEWRNQERKDAKKNQRSISIPAIQFGRENISEDEMPVKTRSKSLHAIEYQKQLLKLQTRKFSTIDRKMSTPTRRTSISYRRSSSISNYDDFYNDGDFIATTAKFISRYL